MSFVRPEAAAALSRWTETMVGGAVALIGLWMGLNQLGLVSVVGWVVLGLGIALMFTGLRHALFRRAGEAPGIVEIIEGRITYMGPILGGTVAVDDLREITFRRTKLGESFWTLTTLDPQPLIIPAGAQGVEQLLDAFTVLPRFNPGAMVTAVQSRTPGARTIWTHPNARGLDLIAAARHP